jgi:multisubunit Na+/H+ antiporter MnhC subunit
MAVAALLLWLCTAAVGSYLLATAAHASGVTEPDTEPDTEPAAAVPVPGAAAETAAPAKPVRARDRFDPPSLQRAKNEPVPGLKALAEFAHPALAMIGFGIWFGYVVSRDRLFAEIGLGVLLGAICAGLSWFTVNTRAARRARAAGTDLSAAPPGTAPLTPPARVLTAHAIGAALTLLFAVLIAVRV